MLLLLLYRAPNHHATSQRRHQTSSNSPPGPRPANQQQPSLLPSTCAHSHQWNDIYQHHGYSATSRPSSCCQHGSRCPAACVHTQSIIPGHSVLESSQAYRCHHRCRRPRTRGASDESIVLTRHIPRSLFVYTPSNAIIHPAYMKRIN